MIENLETLEAKQIPSRVKELYDGGYRYVTITCCTNPDGTYDLFYSFDCDYKLITLKTTVGKEDTVESISGIIIAAAFAENEISELFGVKISGKAIDYGGHFMLAPDAPQSPFGSGVIIERKGGAANAR